MLFWKCLDVANTPIEKDTTEETETGQEDMDIEETLFEIQIQRKNSYNELNDSLQMIEISHLKPQQPT